jgi:hypothetical protein
MIKLCGSECDGCHCHIIPGCQHCARHIIPKFRVYKRYIYWYAQCGGCEKLIMSYSRHGLEPWIKRHFAWHVGRLGA